MHEHYHDPAGLIESMMAAGELSGFVADSAVKRREAMVWDAWLHKEWEADWAEYRARFFPKRGKHIENKMQASDIVRMSLAVCKATQKEV